MLCHRSKWRARLSEHRVPIAYWIRHGRLAVVVYPSQLVPNLGAGGPLYANEHE